MKTIRIVLLILIIIGIGLLATQRFWVPKLVTAIMNYTDEADPSQTLIFEKRASWGPCPYEGGCFEMLYLYKSGKIVVDNENGRHENQLSKEFMERFNQTVEQTGIMQKKCVMPLTADYSVSYTIVHDGKKKNIESRGCEEELKTIDALFKAQD
ncbi:MAG: hypothetical protein A2719_01445 [Candidatus Ryanbacteria bacterium RIFCSPHIGHO2_01_FULL_45_22]|uniref:Uncharacterized protein n=2 Tax=Candidatus Ryaniibacteriota TaxID=1817914 RepID=A0A1G2G073_9BACT|nr:MAG: hypothetical protein A2719_01445 [Candidatus Ryanbacteria bacterium RIFCSPHIGHO2_01_FULL_45_22]OGZ46387.1 MAG: hypothetical protein A3J54_04330 [Candidatus Ryanbacteria bacterium RIFCSPHIGHO2_02_FULL_45_13b]